MTKTISAPSHAKMYIQLEFSRTFGKNVFLGHAKSRKFTQFPINVKYIFRRYETAYFRAVSTLTDIKLQKKAKSS